MQRVLLVVAATLAAFPASAQWAPIPHATPALDLNDIVGFSGTNEILVAGDSGLTVETTDAYATAPNILYADTTGEDDLASIDVNSSSQWWIGGRNGTVLITLTASWPKSWSDVSPPGETTDFHIYSQSSGNMFAAGAAGKLLFGTLSGGPTVAWDTLSTPTSEDLNGGLGPASGTGHVVGDAGTILQTSNGVDFWVDTTLGVDLYDIAGIGSGALLVVGAGGSIYKSNNSGADTAWVKKLGGLADTLYSIGVSGLNANFMIVAGGNGTILRSTDNGETWCRDSTGVSAHLRGAYALSNNDNFAVGDGGLILSTSTGGGPCSSVVLPVELTRFEALADGDDVVLTWETATETDNSHFEVEHRVDGSYRRIGTVEGAGTTTEGRQYEFRLKALAPGVHTFRLKQVDFDGTSVYSDPVSIELSPERFAIMTPFSPNPARSFARATLTVVRDQQVSVELFDVIGRRIRSVLEGPFEADRPVRLNVEVSSLPPGVYLLRASGEFFSDQGLLVVGR